MKDFGVLLNISCTTIEVFPNIIFPCILKKWSTATIIGRTTCSNSLLVSILVTFLPNYQNFIRFVSNKQFLPDSYTAFKNKIGLTDGDEYVSENKEVVLAWPYKDCVLEGGMTKEDQKRDEIFYNETLAPDDINRLLDAKVFTNFKRIDKKGEHKLDGFNRDEKGTIKDNLIIKGNNLLALASLKKEFAGKVKLIYIDPPYNTGNDGFRYNDSFNHSSWLVFMKNRLEIAKNLLNEEGTIAISIDQNEIIYTQLLCEEVFGQNNRKNIITIKRSSVSGAKVINPGVVNVSEYLVLYCKNPASWKPNKVYRKKERDERYNSFIVNYEKNPENWKFSSVLEAWALSLGIEKSKLKKHLKEEYEQQLEEFYFQNSDRIFQFVTLDNNAVSDAVIKIKEKSERDDSKVYILEREDKLNYYIFKGKALLFLGNRLLEIDGKKVFAEMITDIWDDVLPNDLHNEGGVSLKKGKKPEKFLQRIVQLLTKEADVVLDFFAGSGTAGAVAHKMARQYILIEQMDYIHDLPESRLKNVINGEQSGISKAVNWKGGGDFVYMELAKWNEAWIEKIEKAKTGKELAKLWDEMKKTAFFSYKVDPKTIDANAKEFADLSIADQKKFLIECLDKNQLYINLSEIEDKEYGVSKEDQKLNKGFYGK
ncbi:MAG: type III restriction endonuclease subunit M [Candidatus Vogelbacteria bacterium CG10_big_fil_rev_8_21_14_0_10_45_14]|uniref:Type III restriction endonuclease subunit M n=1 Tax=Candidatus Vogelbacteria bacterium CG10_big_fil_rev_8_21_14_0_10_45_14 TaxID=1975042 RepID=A0A2H0RJY2_9BACT|nr:MAG: type III restriction endonuclease subunit M [Candidatus Vogelbacteria bacterium CG10_big_fil_rev_8_21_14_0_10_45_14]